MGLRLFGPEAGTNLGTVQLSIGSETASTTVPAHQQPATITGLPRINSGQADGDTLTIDPGGLTITGYQWQEFDVTWIDINGATSASYDTTGQGHAGKSVRCATPEGSTPPVHIYMQMAMASHNADDVALLDLVPQAEATHIAIANGNWEDAATWFEGRVPRWGARALVPFGITLTYDHNGYERLDWLRIDGRLDWATDQSTEMLCETIVPTRGSEFFCGEASNRISAEQTADILISNRHYRSSSIVPTDLGGGALSNDPTLLSRGIISQGSREMWGAPKESWLRTADGSAPMAGDTTVTLAKPAMGWRVGDEIVVGGTNPQENLDDSESEVVTITAVSSNTVTFTPALTFDHDHHNPAVTRTDLQPGIGMLSHNIKIRTEGGDNIQDWRRGHSMDMHMPCHIDLWHVEHNGLGRTVKNIDGLLAGSPNGDGTIKVPADVVNVFTDAVMTTASNRTARYAFHSHFVGYDKANRDRVNACSVRNTPGWGFAHHSGDVLMNENFAFEFKGAGFSAETGDEVGEWVNNLAIKSVNREANNPKVLQGADGLNGDDARWGYGFAFRGRALRSTGNFAMDCGNGHVYMHRQSGVSITLTRGIPRRAIGFGDLQGLRAASHNISSIDYPIIHNNDAEAAGVLFAGLFVSKSNPEQGHGLSINIKNAKMWGIRQHGVDVEYVGQYIITDADCVAVANPTITSAGVLVSENARQVSIVNARVEGFQTGVLSEQGIVGTVPHGTYDPAADPLSAIAGTTAINCVVDIDTTGNVAPLVEASLPTIVEPSHDLPFKVAEWSGGSVTNFATGTLTDTMNAAGHLPKPSDASGMPVAGDSTTAFISGYLDLVGGYDLVDGVPYIVFPLYFADRYTGVPIRSLHGIEITGSLFGLTQRRSYSLGANTITVPEVQFNVAENGSQTIDVLALASDTAGANLSFARNPHNTAQFTRWNPDHGRLTWDGTGSFTYAPDAGYTGDDFAWVFIEDDIGNSQRVDFTMNVT